MVQASKSDSTRAVIIEHALEVASHEGLESLTIGSLADSLRMSKSGVFARVGSRETLQLAVLANYRKRFEAQVMYPAQSSAPGLPRLRRLFAMSLGQVASGQSAMARCPFSATRHHPGLNRRTIWDYSTCSAACPTIRTRGCSPLACK